MNVKETMSRVASGGLGPALLAYVFLRGWAALAMNLHATMGPAADVAVLAPLAVGLWMIGRLAAAAGFTMAGGVPGGKQSRAVIAYVCLALLELGLLLVTASANEWVPGGAALLSAGAFVCGVATESLALVWYEVLAAGPFAQARGLIVIDLAFETLVSLLCFCPMAVGIVLCAAMPVVCVLGYVACARETDFTGRANAAGQSVDDKVRPLVTRGSLTVGIGVALLFFGAHFLQNGLTGSLMDGMVDEASWTWSAIGGRAIALAVLVALLRYADEMRFDVLFGVTAIVAIAGFLALPLDLAPASFVAFRTLTVAACFLAGRAMLLLLVSVAGQAGRGSTRLIAAGETMVYTGHTLSIAASTAITGALGSAGITAWLYPVSAVSILTLAVSGIWLLRRDSIERLIWRDGKDPAKTRSKSQECADRLARSHALTEREVEVLTLLLDGRSIPFVADTLLVSQATVKTHVGHIYQKLGVHNRQDLITIAQAGATK